ncbi:sulfotransferase family protein [Devosia sp. CAU 1758]
MAAHPRFIYIGAPRSASTWLFRVLQEHPDVYIPPMKEIGYFSRYYERGARWYEQQFSGASVNAITGDMTTSYLHHPHAVDRIFADAYGAKVIVSLRNPIERDYSAYLHNLRNGKAQGSFFEELQSPTSEHYGWIVQAGQYATTIKKLRQFPPETILPIIFDDIKKSPADVASSVFSFLEIRNLEIGDTLTKKVNETKSARNIPLISVARLIRKFMRDNNMDRMYSRLRDSRLITSVLYENSKYKIPQSAMSLDEFEAMKGYYERQITAVEEFVSRPLPHWRETPSFVRKAV